MQQVQGGAVYIGYQGLKSVAEELGCLQAGRWQVINCAYEHECSGLTDCSKACSSACKR